MRIIDDIVSDYKFDKYKKLFNSLNMSAELATLHSADDGIRMINYAKKCKNYEELKDNVIVLLAGPKDNDFLMFTLLFGLYFDVFNLYCYVYINPEDRRDIALKEPNKDSTREFIKKYDLELFEYFHEEYNLDYDTYVSIIDSLFYVNDSDNSMYNSPMIRDIGKILISNTLTGEFVGCRQAIDYFDSRNEIGKHK